MAKGKNRLPIILSLTLVLFLGGFWIYANYLRQSSIVDPSGANIRPKVKMENSATTTDSQAYYDANRDFDRKRAEESRKSGDSSLAKSLGKEEPILNDVEKREKWVGLTAEQVMAMIRQYGAEMESRLNDRIDRFARQPRGDNGTPEARYAERISGFLQRVVTEHNDFQPGVLTVSKTLSYTDETTGGGAVQKGGQVKTSNETGANEESTSVINENKAPIPAGEMLYAVLDVGANSDQPGTPVMARIVMGEWIGAKFLGSFDTGNDRLVLRFNRMVYNGKTYSVTGYAVDPHTLTPGISSNVDYHILERWGGLIAASFLEGFGRAVERSGTRYNYGSYGSNDTVSVPEYSLNDELWIAAGEVGNKASDIFAKNFDRAPTVSLDPGTQVGILVL